MSPATKENTTTAPPQPAQSADLGLIELPTSPSKETGKKQEVLQKTRLDSKVGVKDNKEKTPPSSTTHMHQYALEVWIKTETSSGNFMPLEEESYSTDFVIDTLNLNYPGCTGVYLAEPGHVIAFYGRKSFTRAGFSVDQSTEACKFLSEIPLWMGYMAKVKVRAISLQEASEMVVELKRLEKEDLKKAQMELHYRLSSWRLGHTSSNLSTST